MAASDHLQPAQHKYSMVRTGGDRQSTDRLHHGEGDAAREVGSMIVSHRKGDPGGFLYPNDPATRVGNYDTATWEADEASWKGHDVKWAQRAEAPDGQIPMFQQSFSRTNNQVYLMEMAKGHRAMAGTMLGVANADAEAKTGRGLSTSSNLSPHSLGMVKGLAAKGLVPSGDVPTMAINSISWKEPSPAGYVPGGSQVPHEEMEAGRKAFRSKIRTKPAADPNQGRLF